MPSAGFKLVRDSPAAIFSVSTQQVRKLREVRRQPSCFIPGQQLRRRAPIGPVLEVEVAERLSILVADDEESPPAMRPRKVGSRYRAASLAGRGLYLPQDFKGPENKHDLFDRGGGARLALPIERRYDARLLNDFEASDRRG